MVYWQLATGHWQLDYKFSIAVRIRGKRVPYYLGAPVASSGGQLPVQFAADYADLAE